MFVGRQKYGDGVKVDTMLGPYRPPRITTGPIHALPTNSPSSARSLVYILYYRRTSHTYSRIF